MNQLQRVLRPALRTGLLGPLVGGMIAFWGAGGAAVQAQTPTPQATAASTAPSATTSLADIERKLQADPGSIELRYRRAMALSELGRETEALDVFRQLNVDQPNSAEILNNLGVLLARQGQLDEAATALRAAIEREPGYRLAMENLGDVHVRQAVGWYERLLQSSNDNPGAAAKLRWVSALALPASSSVVQSRPVRAPAPLTATPMPVAPALQLKAAPPPGASVAARDPARDKVSTKARDAQAEAGKKRDEARKKEEARRKEELRRKEDARKKEEARREEARRKEAREQRDKSRAAQ